MNFLQQLWAPPDKSPEHALDDIYPLHMLDDTKTLRTVVVTWTLRFNHVLDTDLLRDSLSRLLDIGDWRKLGGRLRWNANGALELHVPHPFSADRPAIAYSCQRLSSRIDEHPLAKLLPRATDKPSIQPGPDRFREFSSRSDAPATLKDYLADDTPVLSLHITAFSDATLVALSWPHVLMDVMAQQALLRGWSLVLAGEQDMVPPLLGAREDVLLTTPEVSNEAIEKMKLTQRRLGGFALAAFGARFGWDILWNPVVETKTIFLPMSAVTMLRQRAQADLDPGDFISDGDILTAWATNLIASSLPTPRPVTVIHPANARFRLPGLAQSAGVYIQNMALASLTFLSQEAARGPLGKLALENRRQLAEQTTSEHVYASLQDLRSQPQGARDPSGAYGDADSVLIPMTNWTKADIFNSVDFKPAVVDHMNLSRNKDGLAGKLAYHHSSAMQSSAAVRNVVVVLGKDRQQNYWLTAMLLPQTWTRIEEEIAKL